MMLKQQLTEAVTLSVGYDAETTTHTREAATLPWSTMLKQQLTQKLLHSPWTTMLKQQLTQKLLHSPWSTMLKQQ
jgi:uncharacterized protein YaaW (UPF0174 family)